MKKTAFGLVGLAILIFFLIILGFILNSGGASLVGICILLGFLIKSMDQFIDEPRYKKYRILIAPFAVIIPLTIGYLAYVHDPVFGMVIGTALGLILTGKIDHPAFIIGIIGFIIIIVILVLAGGLEIAITSIYIIPFAFIGCFADEIGHEKMSERTQPKSLKLFFEHRFALKIAAVICTVLGFAQVIHLVAFLCFDIAYDITAISLR
ncbi:MAG: hypothetical protein JSV56_01315 [Methanomassiliicoccales archaeon]|nr:MAG: hypothetical protein JSV56_01315 [Methanomassiliicoccales archaeon]